MRCWRPSPRTAWLRTDWPSRPVTIVNLFGAGGSGDFASRAAAKALSDKLGQPFVVENRPGAGGTVGTVYVAKSKPDGYTLLMTATGPAVLNQLLFKSVPYDTDRDFAPVILVGELPQVIVAGPQFKTLKDLIDYGRANPGKLNIGHAGAGSTGHLAAALLMARSGVQATFVGYRSANAVVADVLSGQIQAGVPLYVPSVNTVNVLAVTSEQRVSFLPNIPTAREAGSELVASTWVGLLAPRDAGRHRRQDQRHGRRIHQVAGRHRDLRQGEHPAARRQRRALRADDQAGSRALGADHCQGKHPARAD